MIIHHWKLNGDGNDSIGSAHLTPEGISWTQGIYNQAASFDTTSSRLVRSNGVDLPSTASFAGWGYHTTTSGNYMLFSCNSDSHSGPDLYFTGGDLCWNTGDGSQTKFGVLVPEPTNQWYHYVVLNDENEGKTKLYINGQYAGVTSYRDTYQNNKGFTIGNYTPTSTSYDWQGLIQDMRVYDHILSERDIKWLASGEELSPKQEVEIDKAKKIHFTFDHRIEATTNHVTTSNMESYSIGHTGNVCGFSNNFSSRFGSGNYDIEIISADNSPVPGLTKCQRIQTYTSGWGGWTNGADIGGATGSIVYAVWIRLWHGEIQFGDLNTSSRLYLNDSNCPNGRWHYATGVFPATDRGRHLYAHDETKADILAIQIENSDTPHPYTSGSRPESALDISSNIIGIMKGPSLTQGIVGNNCYSYNSTNNDYIQVGFSTYNNKNYTIACWFKTSNKNQSGQLLGGNPPSYKSFSLYLANGSIVLNSNNGSSTSTSDFHENVWHHIIGIFDSDNGTMKIYVNGIEKASSSWGGTFASQDTYIRIGTDDASSPEFPFSGEIDDVRIYEKVLSQNEINEILIKNYSFDYFDNIWCYSASGGSTTKLYNNGHLEYDSRFNKNIIEGL